MCFPEWKQKRKIGEEEGGGGSEEAKRRKEEEKEEVEERGTVEVGNLLRGFEEVIGGLLGLQSIEKEEEEKDEDEEGREAEEQEKGIAETTDAEENASMNDRLCHLCM